MVRRKGEKGSEELMYLGPQVAKWPRVGTRWPPQEILGEWIKGPLSGVLLVLRSHTGLESFVATWWQGNAEKRIRSDINCTTFNKAFCNKV